MADTWDVYAARERLHGIAVDTGCAFRDADGAREYSLRDIRLTIENGQLTLHGAYDIRAFLKLYRETTDDIVHRTLFDAAIACCYCIDDKCTTLLMAQPRTIAWDGRTKKLCGPYRHRLSITVTRENADACAAILRMMLEHTHAYMHKLPVAEDVTYALEQHDAFFIAGYLHRHSIVSASDEQFIADTLREHGDALRALGGERLAGATLSFRNGSSYDFLFGARLAQRPAQLPEGMICRRFAGGTCAVYRSGTGACASVWRHFTERFYELERMGYDDARAPFEYCDGDGALCDVHIPVDASLPRENGLRLTLERVPDMLLLGYRCFAEADHPQYVERPFDEFAEIRRRFPHAAYVARVSIHAQFGKPLMGFEGVPYDGMTPLPEGMELYTLRGGYEARASFKHFTGDYEAWGEVLGMRIGSVLPLYSLNHPRGFNQYVYRARGGYIEIGSPVREAGARSFELVHLPERRMAGKLEDPPRSVVTDEQKRQLCRLADNAEPGSYWIAFSQRAVPTQTSPDSAFYDAPLSVGAALAEGADMPEGFEPLTLAGGAYVRASEAGLPGEMGWECASLIADALAATGRAADARRPYLYKQLEDGKRYELFIPVTQP